jgi:RimJ/RimL family protein N-acetyltransferase
MKTEIIETQRLRLMAGTVASTRAAAEDDRKAFSSELRATVPKEWPPELLADAQEFFAKSVADAPEKNTWWIWYLVLKTPEAGDTLIGNAGFKGPPNDDGMVEIGYAVLDAFQSKGFATEATQALFEWAAKQPGVKSVIAETFPHLSASIRVMEKCGMTLLGPGSEPETVRYGIKASNRLAFK